MALVLYNEIEYAQAAVKETKGGKSREENKGVQNDFKQNQNKIMFGSQPVNDWHFVGLQHI